MKMASYIMSEIEGIEIFPIISLVIFFAFFTGMGLYVASRKKTKMRQMEHFALEEQDMWETDKAGQVADRVVLNQEKE